ncbi:hypothetical protein AMTRI_Chr03g139460 [Amborella trichopoda]
MAEESWNRGTEECQAPEGHRLCANNLLKEDQANSAKAAVEKSLNPNNNPSVSSSSVSASVPELLDNHQKPATVSSNSSADSNASTLLLPERVGLTWFKCRCGITFCSTHRYPEQHAFDFKAAEREAIATANPVAKAKKLNKI